MTTVLTLVPAREHPELLAPPVAVALEQLDAAAAATVQTAAIDPELADTAAFCERYGVALAESANCVIVAARRGGETRLVACVVLATTRADVNGLLRRHLGARKVSFAPREAAVAATGMEFGGITPIGLPADWPVFVDGAVLDAGAGAGPADGVPSGRVVVGSGIRGSKLWLPPTLLLARPGAERLDGLGRPAPDAAP
jgi:prolyl-tRNA editing enzyme YbaK/EbsC (Cys-tRNA(Pro) deacylase)